MPIWVKIAIFMIALSPIEWLVINMWAQDHIVEVAMKKYPGWILTLAFLIMLNILLVIPVIFWLIFLR